ncbi:MAG: BatD family protein, partial [Elusimicrobiales bacterium]|nr:BatD family protein [Elusimicrobiales bacterium]
MKSMNLKTSINRLATALPRRSAIVTTVFLTILCAFPLLAKAEMSISATVDKETVAIDDTVRLTIAIQSSKKVNTPVVPKMKHFNVYSSGQKQNISYINGKFSYSLQFSYVLTPKTIGKVQIPSIAIFEGHKKRFTSPINIEVVKSNANISPRTVKTFDKLGSAGGQKNNAPEKDDLIFLNAKADKKSAYINEQINLSLKFCAAVPLINNPQYMAPKLEGFIDEDLPPVRTGQISQNGRRYNYHEIKTALFGIDAGTGIINPAVINAQILSSRPNRSGSGFFESFFSGRRGENK